MRGFRIVAVMLIALAFFTGCTVEDGGQSSVQPQNSSVSQDENSVSHS